MEHLSGVLTDQYCHVMMESANPVVSVKEFQHLLGHLYSVIISGVNFQRYRIRLYHNSVFKLSHFVVRIFACLSCETEASEAFINREERLRNFGILHHEINPQVLSLG